MIDGEDVTAVSLEQATETFLSKPEPPDVPAVEAPAASAEPAKPAGAAAAAIEEFIEGRIGPDDKPEIFKVPKGLRLPMKRGEVVEYDPIDRVMTERMLERDYRAKRDEDARRARQVDERMHTLTAAEARAKVERDQLDAERQAFLEAQKDPEKYERFVAHLDRLKSDPEYRQVYDDALAKRVAEAENATFRTEREQQEIVSTATEIDTFIKATAVKYPGVDATRVADVYALQLEAGKADLTQEAVLSIFEAEQRHLAGSPLAQKMAALEKQLADLTAATEAAKHNAITDHALARAGKPPTAPAAGGMPAAPVQPPASKPLRSREALEEAGQRWAEKEE